MYADEDEQFEKGELFRNRVIGVEPDSPELEQWIFEELGRLWFPEGAVFVRDQASAANIPFRAMVKRLLGRAFEWQMSRKLSPP